LGFRQRLAGGVYVLGLRAIVRHLKSAFGGQIWRFAEYHGPRNSLWSFLRNMPTMLIPMALPAHILVTAYVLLSSPTREIRAAR
jgi:hypothetical protein